MNTQPPIQNDSTTTVEQTTFPDQKTVLGSRKGFFAPLKGLATSTAGFFCSFGGADMKIMAEMPSSVILKRAAFGAVMFIIALFSAIIAGAVWGDIFSKGAGIAIGVFWFFLIWQLDRLIAIFLDKNQSGRNKWIAISLRLVIVIIISLLNSTFAEMEIFKKDIQEKLAERKVMLLREKEDIHALNLDTIQIKRKTADSIAEISSAKYNAWLQKEQAVIDTAKSALRAREDIWVKEIEGLVGTGLKGDGDAAKAKKQLIVADSIRLADQQVRLDSAKVNHPLYIEMKKAEDARDKTYKTLQTDENRLTADFLTQKKKLETMPLDGFNHRYKALKALMSESAFVFIVFLFFLVLEALPLIMKIMMGDDLHNEAIKQQEEGYRMNVVTAKMLANQQTEIEFRTKWYAAQDKFLKMAAQKEGNIAGSQMTLSNIRATMIEDFKSNQARTMSALESLEVDPAKMAEINAKQTELLLNQIIMS